MGNTYSATDCARAMLLHALRSQGGCERLLDLFWRPHRSTLVVRCMSCAHCRWHRLHFRPCHPLQAAEGSPWERKGGLASEITPMLELRLLLSCRQLRKAEGHAQQACTAAGPSLCPATLQAAEEARKHAEEARRRALQLAYVFDESVDTLQQLAGSPKDPSGVSCALLLRQKECSPGQP